jgi:hypothetical protein
MGLTRILGRYRLWPFHQAGRVSGGKRVEQPKVIVAAPAVILRRGSIFRIGQRRIRRVHPDDDVGQVQLKSID